MIHEVELLVDAKALVGEGPIWNSRQNVLIWLDIEGEKIFVYDPATKHNRLIKLDQKIGAIVVRKSGGWLVAGERGFALLDPDTEQVEPWSDPESHLPNNRFNDGKCDPAGRFWAGTMPFGFGEPSGALYCLDKDRSVRCMVREVTCSNGIAWSADAKTMYFIDSMTQNVDAFDFDLETGQIDNRRTIISIPQDQGFPDGMTIDSEDNLWVAQWGGYRVACFNPQTGREIDRIDMPVSQVSACWFGGRDLDELYITSARTDLDATALEKEPHAGGLFRAKPGAKGRLAAEFDG